MKIDSAQMTIITCGNTSDNSKVYSNVESRAIIMNNIQADENHHKIMTIIEHIPKYLPNKKLNIYQFLHHCLQLLNHQACSVHDGYKAWVGLASSPVPLFSRAWRCAAHFAQGKKKVSTVCACAGFSWNSMKQQTTQDIP